jgi:1-acyl-sn-glycerol-3-phosphate acyltransferase
MGAVVARLARLVCRLFYRVSLVGRAPAAGPVLLLPNHPNSLLDPAVVWATAGRDVRFLAKSTLFRGHLVSPLVRAAGAIPVYRRIDEGVDASRNREMFAAVADALNRGEMVCLFPEGISHSTGRVEPLRTGAARIALAAIAAGGSPALVPVGLNFERKSAFRSRVTVAYGRAFFADDLRVDLPPEDESHVDPSAAVRTLTARIADEMRRLVVEADPRTDAQIVDRVDQLYRAARGRAPTPEARLERRRTIAAGIEALRTRDPDRYDRVRETIRRYDARLARFGLRDAHLDLRVPPAVVARFIVRELALAVPLLPLCLAGLVLFAVPYRLTGWVARRWAPDLDVVATVKAVGGAILYGLWGGALAAAAWIAGGRAWGLAALAALPIVAVAALYAIERETAARDAARAWLAVRQTSPRARRLLLRRRSEIADLLDDVRAWLDAPARAPHSPGA